MRNLIGVLIIFPEIKYYTATYELIRVRGRVVNGLEYERSQCDIYLESRFRSRSQVCNLKVIGVRVIVSNQRVLEKSNWFPLLSILVVEEITW